VQLTDADLDSGGGWGYCGLVFVSVPWDSLEVQINAWLKHFIAVEYMLSALRADSCI
jgi:hypothetical protein